MTTPYDQPYGGTPAAERTERIVDQAKEQVGQARHKISEQARNTMQQARERAGSAFTARKGQAARDITSVADAVRTSTNQLRDEGHGQIAGYAETIAEQFDRAATYLRDMDAESMRRDVEDLARRQPVLFIGGALALGVLGARFLRSSERHSRNLRFDSPEYGRKQLGFSESGMSAPLHPAGTPYERGGYDGTAS